jgi:hypothetical protein
LTPKWYKSNNVKVGTPTTQNPKMARLRKSNNIKETRNRRETPFFIFFITFQAQRKMNFAFCNQTNLHSYDITAKLMPLLQATFGTDVTLEEQKLTMNGRSSQMLFVIIQNKKQFQLKEMVQKPNQFIMDKTMVQWKNVAQLKLMEDVAKKIQNQEIK